ncbi:hypothetical protein IKA92_04365 [bacterium]|nr:hypothetical protein [bacterium]
MRIQSIKYNSYKPINFGTSRRTVYKTGQGKIVEQPFYDKSMEFSNCSNGQILVSNSTNFFRDDIDWAGFGHVLEELFPNDKKVNVYNFACSDGSEPYSLAITLIEDLGEERAKRYFPIRATDADPIIINTAKSGKIFAAGKDIENLKEMTKHKVDKYFYSKKVQGGYILEAKDILKNNIIFEKEDFATGLNNIKKENSLILCRNFWGYLGTEEIMECAKKLHKKIDETSIILIGDFDKEFGRAPEFLTELGIEEATDLYGEEFILKKHPINKKGKYNNNAYMREKIKSYRKKKLAQSPKVDFHRKEEKH